MKILLALGIVCAGLEFTGCQAYRASVAARQFELDGYAKHGGGIAARYRVEYRGK